MIANRTVTRPALAAAASELLQDIFGTEKNAVRLVIGVASLPLGMPVELELIFEIADERHHE